MPILAPMLRIRRLNGDGRRIPGKGEITALQRPQLIPAQAGFQREPVEQRPLRAGHLQDRLAALLRRPDEPPAFVQRQRAPIVPTVYSHVEPLQVGDRIVRCAPLADHPLAESLNRLKIPVRTLETHALPLPAAGEVF
ncbi:MAG: hypothetical protein ABSA67_11390 [Candidatus Brocadiia bacterium]